MGGCWRHRAGGARLADLRLFSNLRDHLRAPAERLGRFLEGTEHSPFLDHQMRHLAVDLDLDPYGRTRIRDCVKRRGEYVGGFLSGKTKLPAWNSYAQARRRSQILNLYHGFRRQLQGAAIAELELRAFHSIRNDLARLLDGDSVSDLNGRPFGTGGPLYLRLSFRQLEPEIKGDPLNRRRGGCITGNHEAYHHNQHQRGPD